MKNVFSPRTAALRCFRLFACAVLAIGAHAVHAQDLSITKSHTGNFTQGQTGTYTLTVNNPGPAQTSGTITVTDNLPAGLTPTAATGTNWSCTVGGQLVSCTRSAPLALSTTITLTVSVAANAPASVTNTATVASGGDANPANNTASDPTTIIPASDLALTKTHTGSFLQGQVGATYTLTVTNTGGGPTSGVVTVSDTLPAGLTPTSAAGGGWVCNIAGQAVTCSRGDPLSVGASYAPITLTVNVAPAAPPSLTNTATVSGGGDVSPTNNTANDITTIGPGPDLTLNKSHAGNFIQGQTGAMYTLTVTNGGSAPTFGVFTVTDNVPAGLLPTAAAGAGWTCTIIGQTVTCTRSTDLAAGASSFITLTVSVLPGAPASVTNAASVSGGGDVNPTNNSDTDVTAIVPGADLTLTKNHTGNFIQGQLGRTYTITVTNSGVGPTTAAVTMTDTLPLGLTPTAATGGGWSCTVGAQAVGCSRSDALAAGASYPPITLTVNVSPTAPGAVTNVAGVSGGGDSNSANNTASDATTINAGPDLAITKTHVGNFAQGQVGATYTISVANAGASPSSGPVTIADAVPTGLTPTAASGAGWTCSIAGQTVTCSRADALAAAGSYPPITLTVTVAANAPASVTNSATVTGGGDVNAANNTANDPTTILGGPDLAIAKTHVGNFAQGQVGATYTISVANAGASPSSGTVTIADAVPAGLTPTAASGTGWTCSIAGQTVTCLRSDTLAAGASFPPITVTVTVAANAPANLTNSATVSGGGDINTANNTANDVTTISPVPGPAVTSIKRAIGNPTSQVIVTFVVTFSENVTGVDATDFALATTGLSGAAITGVTATSGTTVNVSVNTGTGNGTLRLDLIDNDSIISTVPLGGAGAGNGSFTTGETFTIDRVAPTATIDQAGAQADPTSASPILYSVVFSEPVTGFTGANVSLAGSTATGTLVANVTGSGASYTVSVSGMTGNGLVRASIPAAAANDAATNPSLAATSTDNSVTYTGASTVVTTHTGPSATGSGSITASFTGGGATCSFSGPQFIGSPPGASPIPSVGPPGSIGFPHGLFAFTTINCTPGSTLAFTVTYPSALPSGSQYWKYGPEPGNATPHWYVLPATIAGNVATFSITDGAQGDDDLAANGTIVDQGGPGFPVASGAVQTPTLSEWAMMLMGLLMLVVAAGGLRRRRIA